MKAGLLAILVAGWIVSPPAVSPRSGGIEPAAGRILIASRQVDGPFFFESVVLLLQYAPGGALGLIINRPTRVELAKLLPDLEELQERSHKVYVGGPVGRDALTLLIRTSRELSHARRILPDVYVSSSAQTLQRLLGGDASKTPFRAYVGHAGWAPGQLDSEIARGDWYVSRAEGEVVFDERASELWPRLIRQHTGLRAQASFD